MLDPSHMMEMVQRIQGPSCIPGISQMDLFSASPHLAMEPTNPVLRDSALPLRVAHWKTHSLAELKSACGAAGCQVTGNKSVLALRLSLKGLPANVTMASPTPASKAAGKQTQVAGKRKAPRPPANMDDDEAVESYKDKLASLERDEERARVVAAGVGQDNETLLVGHIRTVEQVVANIVAGDCPQDMVGKAHVLVRTPQELAGRHAVVVLLGACPGEYETADAELLKSVCQDWGSEREYLLGPLFGRGKTMDTIVPALVEAVIRKGYAARSDEPRLARRWAAWFSGVPWSKARLSATNRPSLGSWTGYPWDVGFIMEENSCGLRAGLNKTEATRVAIDFDLTPIELQAPSAMLKAGCWVPVWTKEGGAQDVAAALHKSLAAVESLSTASQGKKARK